MTDTNKELREIRLANDALALEIVQYEQAAVELLAGEMYEFASCLIGRESHWGHLPEELKKEWRETAEAQIAKALLAVTKEARGES